MKIHFVAEPGRWVLRKISEQFAQHLPGATIGTEPDKGADVNVFVNYVLYQPVPTKIIGYFTHRERDEERAKRFDEVAQQVDWCIAMCKKTAAYLPKEKTTIIQAWPEERFYKGKLVLGVVGREYKSGRKRFDRIEVIRRIPGVEVRATLGRVPAEKMPDFYSSIDYLLVLSDNEGGPLPVVESLAIGKPVIAPNVGFWWEFPVLRYGSRDELHALIRGLIIPRDGWDRSASELRVVCSRLVAD